ncbi:LOW QUALITY PROTEIN: cytochrome P450 1B1 [Rhinoraja longicauda]
MSNGTAVLGQLVEKQVGEMVKVRVQLWLAVALSALLGLQVWRWVGKQMVGGLPGPFPWPVVGNAAQLGRLPHLTLCEMSRRYGDLFRIKLGGRTVVVLNGEDVIRQALVRQGADFSGRPDFASFGAVSGGRSLAFGRDSEEWRRHRRVAHSAVRSFSRGQAATNKALEGHVVCEVYQLIVLFAEGSTDGAVWDPRASLVVAVANVICALCFGKRYSHGDEEFRALLSKNERFGRTVGAGSLVDMMPWLQYFPNPLRSAFREFKLINRQFYSFVQEKARERRRRLNHCPQRVRDMLDTFIRTIDHRPDLSSHYVESSLTDIFGASQDTLSTCLHWLILYLIWKPELQEKIQRELDTVVGRGRIPTVEDEPHLPYLVAFLYETLRFSSFVALTIPHATTRDTTLRGYPIPKDTVVFVNQWAVNHDPLRWTQPGLFDPSRFLGGDGSIDKDLTSRVMAFSLGRRRCIGEELSKVQLFLCLSLLAHHCTFKANPSEQLTLDFTYGLTLKPHTFTVNVTLRDSLEHLQSEVERIEQEEGSQ